MIYERTCSSTNARADPGGSYRWARHLHGLAELLGRVGCLLFLISDVRDVEMVTLEFSNISVVAQSPLRAAVRAELTHGQSMIGANLVILQVAVRIISSETDPCRALGKSCAMTLPVQNFSWDNEDDVALMQRLTWPSPTSHYWGQYMVELSSKDWLLIPALQDIIPAPLGISFDNTIFASIRPCYEQRRKAPYDSRRIFQDLAGIFFSGSKLYITNLKHSPRLFHLMTTSTTLIPECIEIDHVYTRPFNGYVEYSSLQFYLFYNCFCKELNATLLRDILKLLKSYDSVVALFKFQQQSYTIWWYIFKPTATSWLIPAPGFFLT
ncbi:hypothetical protein C8R44DRAFT_747201 [Mycena epipterygia]|nr:hypothetical protein C8R44DRAFT_747201 [Mycena epipterygia]